MSREIDEKVVEMRFDNKQFESNVQTSLSTIEKLKKSLDMDGATKGLESIDSATKKVDMSGLGSAVETVKTRFSALEVMAVTTLANITNSVVNTGKQMLHSLTIEPITQGFEEYELKMGSIQTIMMSTGASLEEVNKYLQELNTYSDKTIYSFQDMTSNIGKFTNAGVGLEDAVMAIQGVSNVAAVSGANANEASRAMYNFAQALSAGYVKLIDWKSIENANMATVEFKTRLLESAVACGTVEKTADGMYRVLSTNAKGDTMDEVIDATHNFNDSLSYQWMTTDALVGTLRNYADETTELGKKAFAAAQDVKTFTQLMDTLKEAVGSGWANTWEILFGDFEEAKELWTGLSQVIGGFIDAQADARNKMLQGWKDLGGRTKLIEALKNAFEGIQSVIKPIYEAFRDIFPATTSEQLFKITKGLKELTAKFILSDKTAENLKNTFEGLFAILDIGKQAITAVFNAITKLTKPLFKNLGNASDGLLGFTGDIGQFIAFVDDVIKATDLFNNAFDALGHFLAPIGDGIGKAINKIVDGFKDFIDTFKSFDKIDMSGFEKITDEMNIRFEPLTKLGGLIGKVFITLADAITKAAPYILKFGNIIGEALSKLAKRVSDAFKELKFDSISDLINTVLLGNIFISIKKFINELRGVTNWGEGFVDSIKDILNGVKDSLAAMQASLKAKTLLTIAGAIAILAASIIALSLVDSEKLGNALTAITITFLELFSSMAVLTKISNGKDFKDITKISKILLIISAAVLVLSFALTRLSKLKWDELGKGVAGVASLVVILTASATKLSKSSEKLIKGSTGLVVFAIAINVLAKAVEKLGKISWKQLVKGIGSVGILAGELAIFVKLVNDKKLKVGTATGLLVLAAAINVLARAVGYLGQMSVEAIIKGLGAMGTILTELEVFINITGNAKKVISTATGLTILGAAMLIFAKAIQNMGAMSLEEIGRGLLTMAGALVEVAIAMRFMPNNMLSSSVGMIAISTALIILSKALKNMSRLSWEEIAKGLTVLGVSLLFITTAMNAMTKTLPGAAALLVVSGALIVLSGALKIMGSMPIGEVFLGLLTLAAAFTILGIAALGIGPLAPVLLTLSGSIALLGVGCLAAGAGVTMLATGLSALSIAITTAGPALVVFITSLLSLIPVVIKMIGEGFVALLGVIANSTVEIVTAVVAIASAVLDVIITLAPKLIETIAALLDAVLSAIQTVLPKLVEIVGALLGAVLTAIITYIPQIVTAGVQLLLGLLQGILDNIWQITVVVVKIIVEFINGLASMTGAIIDAGFNLLVALINGITDAISKNTPVVLEALRNMFVTVIRSVLETIGGLVGDFIQIGKDLIGGLIRGITDTVGDVVEAAKGVVRSAVDAAKNLLGIHSPSKVFAEIGRYSDEGLIEGLRNYSGKVADAGKEVGQTALDSVFNAVSKIADFVTNDMDAEPTIRPVLDLSNVETGTRRLNSMFSRNQTMSINANMNRANISENQNGGDSGQNGTTLNFYQTNNSPKALNRIEIYRQTKNQISVMKEVVNEL